MGINPINVILGLKLRQARLQRGLSVTELAARCELAPSYITEIEKGRKYPKADKILRLARCLELDYDQLVSLRLDPPLAALEHALSSQAVREFPLELFGLDPGSLVQLFSRSPAELGALLQALADIARGYNIREEHFLRAALRSYQELHDNYFQALEQAADAFSREHLGPPDRGPARLPDEAALRAALVNVFGYRIVPLPTDRHPALAGYRSVAAPQAEPPILWLNPQLWTAQRRFALARELGYRVLGLQARALTSSPDRVESFAQVLNDFKAAYFAGCLLMPASRVLDDLRDVLTMPRWQEGRALLRLLGRYGVTPETLMYRFSELIPHFFGLKLHFLRFDEVSGAYHLVKQLNMSQLALPAGFDLKEHYCRRWLTIRIIRELAARGSPGPIVGAQRSRFVESHKQFLCLGFARQDHLPPYLRASFILGMRYDDALQATVRFAADPEIPEALLNETCERCPLSSDQCAERAAPPVRWQQDQAVHQRQEQLHALLNGAGQEPAMHASNGRGATPAGNGRAMQVVVVDGASLSGTAGAPGHGGGPVPRGGAAELGPGDLHAAQSSAGTGSADRDGHPDRA